MSNGANGNTSGRLLENATARAKVGTMVPRDAWVDEEGRIYTSARQALDILHLWAFVRIPASEDEA